MFGFAAKKLDLFGELVCRTNVLLKKYQKIRTPFNDVIFNEYYNGAVAWGYSPEVFGVGDYVTREQFVTFLYRYATLFGYDVTLTLSEKEMSAKYSDFEDVSPFAKEAIIWTVSKGIISGKEGKYLAPQDGCQGCEAAQIFYNIYSKEFFFAK